MKYLLIIILICSEYASCDNEYQNSDNPICLAPEPTMYYYGVVIGINKSNLNHSIDNLSNNSNIGVNYGIQLNYFLDKDFTKSILLRASYFSNRIEYDFKKTTTNINDIKFSENNKYFQLSSCYQFYFISKRRMGIYTSLGPYFNYSLDDISSKNSTIFNNKSFNKYEIGASVGIGFDYGFRDFILGIDYNYNYAFTDKYNYQNDYIKNNAHLINFIFSF